MRFGSVLLLLAVGTGICQATENHVQFILDDSQSMNNNDPNRVARLSARLFFVLMNPVKNRDSFTIRTLTGDPSQPESREELEKYLMASSKNLEPDTKYLPVLRKAATELRGLPRTRPSEDVRKIIVFVTDGQPEDERKDYESIRPLCQGLENDGIRLYVLVFGKNLRSITSRISPLFDGLEAVRKFEESDGQKLLRPIAGIFATEFGAIVDAPTENRSRVDIPAGTTEASIITFHLNAIAPQVGLTSPSGTPLKPSHDDGVETRSSFSLDRVESVTPGVYKMNAPLGASTMVVRLAPYILEPCDPKTREPRPNGEALPPVFDHQPTSFCFFVPGEQKDDIKLKPKITKLDDKEDLGRWCTASKRYSKPAGIFFSSECQFPSGNADSYAVEIKGIPVRNESPDPEHSALQTVNVLSNVHIAANLLNPHIAVDGKTKSLHRGEKGCAIFHFQLMTGRLPGTGQVEMAASLDDSFGADPALRGATATLDGAPLPLNGAGSDAIVSMERTGFEDAPHLLCLTAGNLAHLDSGSSGNGSLDGKVTLRLRLTEEAYRELPVVDGVTAYASIIPPAWYEVWTTTILLLAALITAGIVAAGLLRIRYLPDNMTCRSWAAPGGRERESAMPLAPKRFRIVAGDSRDLKLDKGAFTAGTIRAAAPDLFFFVPRPGVDVGNCQASGSRGFHLQAHENYELATPRGIYRFRIEYT